MISAGLLRDLITSSRPFGSQRQSHFLFGVFGQRNRIGAVEVEGLKVVKLKCF
jgi:hypothetical protein